LLCKGGTGKNPAHCYAIAGQAKICSKTKREIKRYCPVLLWGLMPSKVSGYYFSSLLVSFLFYPFWGKQAQQVIP
jgi:hypothetical protein